MRQIFKIDKVIRQVNSVFKTSQSQTIRPPKKIEKPLFAAQKKATTAPPVTKALNPLFFTQLKAEEHKQFTSKKRHRSEYKDNYSAALNLPFSNYQLAIKYHDHNALLSMSQQNIIEHANRRVDLFFYTLIAYYKTEILPTNGHTTLQHGRGRTTRSNTSISEACHSSLTPSLVDTTIYQNKQTGEKHKSLLSDTHFMDSLNSTVELPPFVNDLDDLLENALREKSLTILREVSLGTINPITGLTQFLQIMSTVLKDLKEDAENKSKPGLSQHPLIKQRPITPKLIELVRTGSLSTTYLPQTQTANDAYIQLLLRMTPEEKASCKDECSKEKVYLNKITELQNEILHTKSNGFSIT
ncbi:hypothetical protein LEAN103870_18160 [Legionella anisa]|uniref:Uncharacterized protein n=1 Tax=Legionella anisa TaxID=28082 RepID=A0AAX0WR61_9GAMM|nr:hypothetical protein [Legionella anisa]AWN75034.1 hypothetical protein DLD14_14970 [Legionella anisa]KTC69261.1 hypothetical protein Lani_2754 [Legionella anisa]PNL61011.1 hypothetical protein A6J39_007170 [Legionella anisa]UAK80240.1 hypothetical protein K8O89_03995 [Legionella anisa]